MVLYTLKDGAFINYAASLEQQPEAKGSVYVNLTNRCNCACRFCLRNTKEQRQSNSLWLDKEPTAAEVIAEFARFDMKLMREIVFCGFGEPTLRLETLLEVARYLKSRDSTVPIRVNTNGLADLAQQTAVAPFFKDLVDTISISLNAATPEKYFELTRSGFGLDSHAAVLAFAQSCKAYVPNVVLTVVDCIGAAEIAACRKICSAVGVPLRVRRFE